MFEFKLQLGCIAIILYFVISYVKETTGTNKIKCSPYYDALLYILPWSVVFDGVTAWTVNHMNIVPDWLNMLFHALFILFMVISIYAVFIYMINQIIGIHSKKKFFLISIPSFVAIISILLTLPKLYFIEGKTTNYSMGIPVYICYSELLVHFIAIAILLIIKFKNIERRKLASLFFCVFIDLLILIIQIIQKEALISAIMPTITLVCFYMSFEDPSFRRLQRYNEDMTTSFATLVENRDDNTGGHIRRTKGYVQIILNQLRKDPRYHPILTADYLKNVINAAPLHDIGKIGTPDDILRKPGKLTAEEFEIMKKHSVQGGNIIKETFTDLEEPDFQKIAFEVARFHHEKWNGKGYPDGLKEKEIPLHARIMSIADVFDAVSAKRCYRDAMPIEDCFKIIEEGAGRDFDPDLAKIFLNAKNEVLQYYEEDKETSIYKIWSEK